MKRYDIIKRYGLGGSIRLLTDIIKTKIFFPSARIVRRPYYIRGKRNVDFGQNLTTGVGLRVDVFSEDNKKKLVIGNNVQINDYVHIGVVEKVIIGNNVLIASKVLIIDHNHGSYNNLNSSSPDLVPAERKLISKSIVIEDNVWIGELACILPGVTVGKGSVIGAGAVITRDVPKYSVMAGNPAKIIKQYNTATKKWEYV